VTNPVGTFLPGSQGLLEAEWKRQMARLYDVEFSSLYTITNMPVSRFLEFLEEGGALDAYMERLVTAFNPAAATGVMCRNTLSVGYDGTLYDCDFNQMLDLPVHPPPRAPSSTSTWPPSPTARSCWGRTASAAPPAPAPAAAARRRKGASPPGRYTRLPWTSVHFGAHRGTRAPPLPGPLPRKRGKGCTSPLSLASVVGA
jgi:hypothetical protein